MSFTGSAQLSTGDDPDNLDDTIGYRGSSRASQNDFADSEDAQVVDSTAVMGEDTTDDDGEDMLFQQLYNETERRLAALFGGEGQHTSAAEVEKPPIQAAEDTDIHMVNAAPEVVPTKTARRNLDDDDYDEYDEEEEGPTRPVLTSKHSGNLPSPSKSGSSPAANGDGSPTKQSNKGKEPASSQEQPKSAEDARKKLEADKKAAEDAVKRSLNTVFYTLENDRIAMLEQQRLEESEKQIDAEMDNGNTAGGTGNDGQHHGTLSSANLGASSLTLKHLIARIDMKRELVKASDAELRSLMNEVRKNRSKWASEEQVGQEELYEAAEKVLSELKAMTEYSAPFLTRVNKRDAPDYNMIIKTPMDLGTMTKKLKQLAYKSKAEFVNDLNLIWSNCLKYNADPAHPLRRNAIAMRKEAEKLVPLIPEIVVRPRAEVEAEERRKQNGAEDDAADDTDEDDKPLKETTRGRKAPNKGSKGSAKSRKTVGTQKQEGTPGLEQKPNLPVNSVIGNLIHENSDSAFQDGSLNGLMTPPVGGTSTPGGHGAGSQADIMDLDGPSINGMALGHPVQDLHENEEYKIWKQVTKKDRALVAKERHKLFKGDKLNIDEPALLRTKAGMRRWVRQHKNTTAGESTAEDGNDGDKAEPTRKGETLAEEMEGNVEDPALPDYYDALSAIPDLNPKQEWVEDADGNLVDKGEYWHMVPKGYFTAPQSKLTEKINANMRQIQETRKICSKIGIVKQMQLQSQMYNNQFQKYDPEPFHEDDIPPHVQSEPGPVMAEWTCKAALQRSVGEICYHAGFEELQPSAIDVITDIAADYFQKISRTFAIYRETPKIPATGEAAKNGQKWMDRYSNEELMLHTLAESGVSVEELEAYVTEGVDRYGNKLGVMHERMKSHLTDLLRPALVDAGEGGVAAFNDGSEQFVGGDFAEDIDEDFFGFKELGLDKEFGLASLSVPLHLLQSRVHSAHNAGLPGGTATTSASIFEPLPPLPPITKESVKEQVGLVRNFFLAKLHANGDEPLVEDEDLPVKQRFPKPRLPPTGKITSPRKRPARELGGVKKKKKLEIAEGGDKTNSEGAMVNGTPKKNKGAVGGGPGGTGGDESPMKKRKLAQMKGASDSNRDADGEAETDDGPVGPISPESIER